MQCRICKSHSFSINKGLNVSIFIDQRMCLNMKVFAWPTTLRVLQAQKISHCLQWCESILHWWVIFYNYHFVCTKGGWRKSWQALFFVYWIIYVYNHMQLLSMGSSNILFIQQPIPLQLMNDRSMNYLPIINKIISKCLLYFK